MSEEKIAISTIRRDGGTQARVATDKDYVEELRTVLKSGGELPEVVVFFENEDRWLADGFHTVAAYEAEEKTYINAKMRKGTLQDAILYAAGANDSHGLRRTPADKRKAVSMVLAIPEYAERSDRWVAEQCRISDHLVASVRKESTANSRSSEEKPTSTNGSPAQRTGKDGKKRPATQPRATKERDAGDDTDTEKSAAKAQRDSKAKQGKPIFDDRIIDDLIGKLSRAWNTRQEKLGNTSGAKSMRVKINDMLMSWNAWKKEK
jgi:hypothetical protein